MKTLSKTNILRSGCLKIPGATLAVLPLVIAMNAHAIELDFGENSELSGNLDMTLGYAASWRAEDADPSDLVSGYGARGLNYTGEARDPDAGNLITNIARVTGELSLDWRNYGLVTSGTYQYDHEIMRDGNAIDIFSETSRDPSDAAKDYAGNSLDLLDAYVYGSFEVGENANPLEVRVGKQVINWGEGLFFINGVATQVPLNFNKLTTPGAELKEAYIGNEAIYAQLGVGDESSLEAYYQWGWNRTELPPMDTFYGSEALGRGGTELISVLPARDGDIEASDTGQWGIAYRTVLGDAEVGVYYSRYHDTLPLLEWHDVGGVNSIFDASQFWAEDQDMLGASIATTLGDWSFNAEVAYRPDQLLWTDFYRAGAIDANGRSVSEHDTVHASAHGIWLGGPIDFLGVDSQVVLAQVGMDYISGDRTLLSPNAVITRASDQATITPDEFAFGAAVEWTGTWQAVRPGTDVSLDIYLQHDFAGNSHYWGNFAEGRTLYAASLTANVGSEWEAGLVYSGFTMSDSDYADQDTIGLSINYKF